MPSLNAMRELEPGDSAHSQPLGPAIQPAKPEPAAPPPKPTGTPGVFERADGKLETNLPTPSLRDEAIERAWEGNFAADYSKLEERLLSQESWRTTYQQQFGPAKFGAATGRMLSRKPNFIDVPKTDPRLRGQRATTAILDEQDFSDIYQSILAYCAGTRQTFANESEINEDTFVAAFLALSFAEEAGSLPPSDGAMWTAHDPIAGAVAPREWEFAVLRNGDLRKRWGESVADWGDFLYSDYQVVAWR